MSKLQITPSKVEKYGINIAKDGVSRTCIPYIRPKICKYE